MPTRTILIRFTLCFCGLLNAFLASAAVAAPPSAIERVLVVSIDGLRPDLMLLADAPNLRALMHTGSYSLFAQTIHDAYTLPSHVSMLTGVLPEKHGVTWNDYTEDSYPEVPTLFELAKKRGLTTAMAVAKMKFIVFAKPGVLDWKYIANEDSTTDADVAREACKIMTEHQPKVMFVHFGDVDIAGHAHGWGSAEQLKKIHEVDAHLGTVLGALWSLKLDDSTLIIVTADHGGSGLGHGPDDMPSKFIPWIAVGPGVRKDFDLT